MRKTILILFFVLIQTTISLATFAQCAMCTKTAQQLGEKPALGLNQGILYLMLMPFALVGFIGFKWWKYNRNA